MQLTSHASSQDLTSEIDTLCDTNSTSYPLPDKVRRINAGLEEIVGRLVNADGMWQYDDTNYTDAPRGTGNLVEGQEAYSFASEYLTIEQVDVLDKNGYWRRLKSFDPNDLDGLTPEEYFGSTTSTTKKGMPEYYDPQGDSIRLYPAPAATNVTLTAGLRIFFKRTASLFTTSDTTKEPGIPSPYHVLLAYFAAIPYCMAYKKDRVVWLEKKWMEGVAEVLKFHGRREKDRRKVATMKKIQFR